MHNWSNYLQLTRFAATRTMTLIEGVGDEVTDFFIVVGVLCVGWIAWCSTNIGDQPLIRTVLILQHRTRTRIAAGIRINSRTVTAATNAQVVEITSDSAPDSNEGPRDEADGDCPTPNNSVTTGENIAELAFSRDFVREDIMFKPTASSEVPTESTSPPPAAASEEVLIEAMDSFNNDDTGLLRRPVKISNSETTPTNVNESSPVVTEETVDEGLTPDEENEITIKLKFMNDDQKLVTGRLKEMLGEFKRRHFQVELESQKRVRLVFNGQLLQPDSDTLERFGLYNNCVVHCLVHQQRVTSTPTSQPSTVENSSSIYTSPQSYQNIPSDTGISSAQNEWDLSKLLFSILTLILAFAWYSRYHYAQLFTATTTLALYALTAVFSLSVVGHFFPDQDALRNIE